MLPSRYLLPVLAVLLCIAPPLPAADEGAPGGVSLDEYIARLGADSRMERLGAARAIVEMGDKAKAAMPALMESLQDEDEAVRMVAAAGLALVDPGAPQTAPALTQALQDRDARVRQFAAVGIGALGAPSEGIAEALQRAMSDPDERVRREAGLSIEHLQGAGSRPEGFDIESARPTLDRPTLDRPTLDRPTSERPIAQRPEGEAPPAEPPPGQTSPSGSPRRGGAGGGASSAPPSATATQPGPPAGGQGVVQLVQQLKDPDPARRLSAVEALERLGAQASPATAALQTATYDDDARVRAAAQRALENLRRMGQTVPVTPEPPEPEPEGRIFFLLGFHKADEDGIEPLPQSQMAPGELLTALMGGDPSKMPPEVQAVMEQAAAAAEGENPNLDLEDVDFFIAEKLAVLSRSFAGDTYQRFLTNAAKLYYLDLKAGAAYRREAMGRGLETEGLTLRELLEGDPERGAQMRKHRIFQPYKQDHVIRAAAEGQVRYEHRRYVTGDEYVYGAAPHQGILPGEYQVDYAIYTVEGFELRFTLPVRVEPLHEELLADADIRALASISGPADVGREYRQKLASVDMSKPDAQLQRADHSLAIAYALSDAVTELVNFRGDAPGSVLPFIREAVSLHEMVGTHGDKSWSVEHGGIVHHCAILNTQDAFNLALKETRLAERWAQSTDPNQNDPTTNDHWGDLGVAYAFMAHAHISRRNDVPQALAWLERKLSLRLLRQKAVGQTVNPAAERNTWPQPGWWRSEWDTLRPPGFWTPDTQDDDQPPPPPDAPPSKAQQILAKLKEALEKLDEQRAQDVRWINGVHKSLLAAERRKAEVRGLLRVGALMAERIRGRIVQLRKVLAEIPETESRTYLEAIFKAGIDKWDSTWGPPPQSNEQARTVIRQQVADLGKQLEEILRDQDAMIEDTVDTYYNTIIQEIKLKGDKSLWEDVRKVSKVAKQDVEETLALAKAELWLASGQGDKFRVAAREAMAGGKYEARVRFMEAMHFHSTKDYAHALHSYRRVLEIAALMGEPMLAMTEEEAKKFDPEKAHIFERARQMTWILERAYLNAIDQKASGEAAVVRSKSAERLEKGGAKGWLGWLIAHVKMGVFSASSAIVGREDALENLASQFQQNVGAQHGGLLLIKSLHERGVPLDQIDGLTNDQFIQLIRERYPEHDSAITPEQALRLRAAVKAAFANSDVKHLAASPKMMLNVDTGRPYLDSTQYDETAMEWWGDIVNIWNVGTMLGPMSTFRVNGQIQTIKPSWGILGRTSKGGAPIVTAKEAFSQAVGLPKLAAVLGKTKAGQFMVKQFSKFFSESTWLKDRALDATIQLMAAKTGEAMGGTMGVLMGSDGKVEAEFGQMLGQLFTAWGAGDVDVMKKIMIANHIKPLHLKALISQAEQIAETSAETATVVGKHVRVLENAVPEVEAGGLTAGTRGAVRQSIGEIKQHLSAAARKFQAGQGTPELCRQVNGLKMAYEGLASAEAGMVGQAKAWQDIVQEAADGANVEAQAMSRQSQSLRLVAGQLDDAPQPVLTKTRPGIAPPTVEQPDEALIFGNGDKLTRDLDKIALEGDYGKALSGYERRLALLKQIGAGDKPEAQALALRARELRQIWGADHRLRIANDPMDMGHTNQIMPGEIEAMDANPNIVKVRMAQSDADATFSDPYWVWKMEGDRAVKVGVFKGSAPNFPDHYDLRAEVLYYKLAKLVDVDVPACKVGTMTINGKQVKGLFVRIAPGTSLEYFDNGTHIAVKEYLSRDKVLATVLGDHDRRPANYLLAGKKGLRSIDHGMADPCGRQLSEAAEFADDDLVHAGIRTRIVGQGRGQQHLDYLDQHITMENMMPTIRQIQTLFEDEDAVRKIVESVYLDPKNYPAGYDLTKLKVEVDAAMKTLYGRVNNLESSLGKFYGSSELLGDPPTPGTAWQRDAGELAARPGAEAAPALPLAA